MTYYEDETLIFPCETVEEADQRMAQCEAIWPSAEVTKAWPKTYHENIRITVKFPKDAGITP